MAKHKLASSAGGSSKRQKKYLAGKVLEGSHEEVLIKDVQKLLSLDENQALEHLQSPLEKFSEFEIDISELSSTGDGLGLATSARHAFVVPFSVPGDRVKAKVIYTNHKENYTVTDFLQVIEPSSKRDDSLVKCQYFAKCSGCQIQMLRYEDQLAHKRTILEKAYQNFSGLRGDSVPVVEPTIGSPLEYGYRTKLTPHFDRPGGRKRQDDSKVSKEVPPIGFMQKGTRWTIDIEDCPIGTDAVRAGMKSERERVAKDIASYTKGATLLLRESTERKSKVNSDGDSPTVESTELPDFTESKTCITDNNGFSTEYVGSDIFLNPAGSFFQNNNSILPIFTEYIRDQIKTISQNQPLHHLIDAYCGSGLFTITLSSLFKTSIGIDIASPSIECARKNSTLNKTKNTTFIAATASDIFASVTSPPEETVVVIDPPRKGCDQDFLGQLLRFGPRVVVYVSCNVHTQARDVGVLVNGKEGSKYKIESLRGFDFFPQTGHVEGVALLSKN